MLNKQFTQSVGVIFVAVAALVLATAGTANASPWTVPSGSTPGFTYNSGANNTDLFGEPIVSDGVTRAGSVPGFAFLNTVNFMATAAAGSSDWATVTLFSTNNPLFVFDQFFVEESGTWSAPPGTDPLLAFPNIQADVSLQSPFGTIQHDIFADFLEFQPMDPITGIGTWTARGTLNYTLAGTMLSPFGVVKVTNTLQVEAAFPTAIIEKTSMNLFLPEPTSAVLILTGLIPLMVRRSRRSRIE